MAAKATKRKRTTSADSIETAEEYEVETVLNYQWSRGRHLFFVKWAGYAESNNSWEPIEGLLGCRERIMEYFHRTHNARIEILNHHESAPSTVTQTDTKSTNTSNYTRKSQNDVRSSSSIATMTTRKNPVPHSVANPSLTRISLSPIVRLQRINGPPSSSASVEENKRCRRSTKNISTKKQIQSSSHISNVFPSPSPSPSPSPTPSMYSDNSGADSESDINSDRASVLCEEGEPEAEEEVSIDVDDELDENDPRVVTVLTILPHRNMEVYKIHGAVNVTGNLTLLVEWDTDERDLNLVDAKLMNRVYPHKVIEFYEKNLQFQRNSSDT